MHVGLQVLIWTLAIEGLFVLGLTIAPRVPPAGRHIANALSQAPLLDIVVSLLTWIPWAVGIAVGGWFGFAGAMTGQTIVLTSWVILHEATHRRASRGPRIVKVLNRTVGRAPNHLALWVSLLALPVFWIIRFGEILIYPLLRLLLGFPRYRHGQWISVSRHKFEGLVGHDLIWCLYCDWMTGIYALGGEMLRNVESFWCPIRFYDGKKCDNCRIDFPDIDGGWVPTDGAMSDVVATLEAKYGGGRREWYGHPARLTISAERKNEQSSAESEQE